MSTGEIRLRGGRITSDPRLDRVPQPDRRNLRFPIAEVLPSVTLRSRTWVCAPHLDQGQEGACVGFGWAHELAAQPVVIPVDDTLARSLYHIAQTLDEWPGECVDMATTCLSKRGWLNGSELEVDDEILVFDREREGLVWAQVDRVHLYPARAYRVWKHNQLAIAATDEHRWLVRSRVAETGYQLVPTVALKSQHLLPRAASLLDQPCEPVYSDDEVELVAWAVTEGHFRGQHRRGNGIAISQKSHLSRVASLMERLGVARGYDKADGCHVWEVSGSRAAAVREACDASVAWLAKLTKRQLRLFIDACVLGDGTSTSGEKWGRLDRRQFFQKPGATLDLFLAACALAGIPTSRARGGEVEAWSLRASREAEIRKLIPGPYLVGPVWCPQTAHGTFVARRDGSVFITGNSYEGTSVLAGAKACQQQGFVREYRWAFGIDDVLATLSNYGTVVLGTEWREGMFEPGPSGLLDVNGRVAGDHCYLARGNVLKQRLAGVGVRHVVRIRNSWGPGWGVGGDAYMTPEDLDHLLEAGGEACVPVDIRRVAS